MHLVVVIKHHCPLTKLKKKQYFNADNNNIPFENDRYPDLSIVLTQEFRSNIDICATQLWSHPQALSFHSHTSWFKLDDFSN